MGFFNFITLTTESTIILYYILSPSIHREFHLIQEDIKDFFHFRQSLVAISFLALIRMIFFTYIRYRGKRAVATRCFVFFVFLIEMILGTLSSLQPIIFWQNPLSFERYRVLEWGNSFIYVLWGLSLFACLLELGYILRLNKKMGSLADDKLMRDVLGEKDVKETQQRQDIWRTKWQQLMKQFKKQRTDPTFEAIVRLYAHKEGAVERLAIAYERDPSEFEFYLPQLISFLLLGAFVQTPQLCIILLEKCSVSHVFAHRMFWYLKSYCLRNPTFTSEETIQRVQVLMEEVTERGQEPAKQIESPPPSTTTSSDSSIAPYKTTGTNHEDDALLSSKEEQYYTFQDQYQLVDLEAGTPSSDPFGLVSTFLIALAGISSNLKSVAMKNRNDMLRAWLSELQAQFLPSNILYLPVGNAYHRLKRIHVEECFTFSTRERVPFLLCAEVIDYALPQKKARKKSSVFNGRRFTMMTLFENKAATQVQTVVDHGSMLEKPLTTGTTAGGTTTIAAAGTGINTTTDGAQTGLAPMMSPDAGKLGFWSESKPVTSPRMRSISHHITSSIAHPTTEILNGILDTLAGKTTVTTKEESTLSHTADELEQLSNSTPTSSSPTPVDPQQQAPPSQSQSLESLDDVVDPVQSPGSSVGDSPQSPQSPHSPQSPFSPPNLMRIDSTDRYLLTLSERDSKFNEEDEDHQPSDTHSLKHALSRGMSDPAPCVIFKERWAEKEARIKVNSPWGHLPNWRLLPVIVKSNDDLRQEQLASQLIKQFSKVFEEANLPVFIRPYDVIAISSTSGLVEAISDTISLDSLKRNDREYTTLLDFFTRHFGDPSSSEFKQARNNFVSSMAAYSIVCYLLQVKDRHNGNLLLDAEGHLIHIDFGYFLSNNPGNVHFEQAPFKLTHEFVELMGGPRSASFRKFRSLCVQSFLVARKYRHRFILLVEMMLNGNEHLPCFAGDPKGSVDRLAARFQPQLDINSCEDFVHELIDTSLDNWRTRWYDKYQRWFVGVF